MSFNRLDTGPPKPRKPGPYYCADGCGEEVERADSLCTACFKARYGTF